MRTYLTFRHARTRHVRRSSDITEDPGEEMWDVQLYVYLNFVFLDNCIARTIVYVFLFIHLSALIFILH